MTPPLSQAAKSSWPLQGRCHAPRRARASGGAARLRAAPARAVGPARPRGAKPCGRGGGEPWGQQGLGCQALVVEEVRGQEVIAQVQSGPGGVQVRLVGPESVTL